VKKTQNKDYYTQWLKCNETQGNAVPPPSIYGSKRSPTSDCYNARQRHTTIVRGPNRNVAFPPPLILHFNHWLFMVIQGHRCRYQRKPVRDFLLVINAHWYLAPFRSYRRLLFKFWTLCVFEPPPIPRVPYLSALEVWSRQGAIQSHVYLYLTLFFEDLGVTYTFHLKPIGKLVVDFLFVSIERLWLDFTAEALRANIDWKLAFLKRVGQFRPNFT